MPLTLSFGRSIAEVKVTGSVTSKPSIHNADSCGRVPPIRSRPSRPAVVRGRDGQLRIGGTRPHESSLWIDGFDVTDPVTLTSAIDLPTKA